MYTSGSKRLTKVALSVAAVTGIVGGAIAVSSPALASTPGTISITGPTTIAPGGTLTVSVSPSLFSGTGDFSYFCYDYNNPTDPSGPNDPGHSVVLFLTGTDPTPIPVPAGITVTATSGGHYQFSGSGVGNITPFDPATLPLTLDFTLPTDIPEGDYFVFGGCVSPAKWSVLHTSNTNEWVDTPMTITVVKDPTPQPLPDTGTDTGTFVGGATLAVIAVGAGVLLIVLRRRARA